MFISYITQPLTIFMYGLEEVFNGMLLVLCKDYRKNPQIKAKIIITIWFHFIVVPQRCPWAIYCSSQVGSVKITTVAYESFDGTVQKALNEVPYFYYSLLELFAAFMAKL